MAYQKIFSELLQEAKDFGATDSKIIDTSKIVIDERVRLKCEIPRCSSFNTHLMCPPNLMPVGEFRKIVRKYKKALLVQIEAPHDSSDKSDSTLTLQSCNEIYEEIGADKSQKALHRLVNKLETSAFKKGLHLAAGLIGGDCELCPECVGTAGNLPCRHPFEARPSMEGMGIDVVKTCKNAGFPLKLSSKEKVRWTGIILLD